jgi:hypothetical protein
LSKPRDESEWRYHTSEPLDFPKAEEQLMHEVQQALLPSIRTGDWPAVVAALYRALGVALTMLRKRVAIAKSRGGQ